jgi:hypothetical protein
MVDWVVEARQRQSTRRAVDLECEVIAERGFRLLGRRVLDLSSDGMLLRSDADVELGEDVVLTVRAPSGLSWIDGEAKVTRIVRGRRRGDGGRCLGLRFERMDAVSRAMLLGSLRGLPPPVPKRHARRDYATTVQLIALL